MDQSTTIFLRVLEVLALIAIAVGVLVIAF